MYSLILHLKGFSWKLFAFFWGLALCDLQKFQA